MKEPELKVVKNMDGDPRGVEDFIRESIKKNELEAREYLLEERQRRINSLSKSNGLPPLFKKKTFENYDKSLNPLALTRALDFARDFPTSKGLLFLGGVGLGKTHLASAIVNNLNKKLYTSYFGNVLDILAFVKSTYNKNSILSETQAIDLMTQSIDLLVIDDLGKENNTDHNLALVYRIINKLYENEKPLIITTNYGAQELNYRLGERGPALISRISSMCKPVSLSGRDWRIQNER